MLPGALLTAALVFRTFSESRSVVERRLMDAARVDAAALDREFGSYIRALEALAPSPALARGDMAAFREEAVRVQRAEPTWLTLIVLSPDGRQVLNTRVAEGAPLPAVNDAESLTQLLTHRRPVVGLIKASRQDGTYGFPVRIPVPTTGPLQFVLTAVVDVRALAQLVQSDLPATDEWTRSMFDPVGTLAARTREAERYVGRRASTEILGWVASPPEGLERATAMDGTEVYAVMRRGAFGWSTAITVPAALLDAPLRGSVLALILGGLTLMAGGLVGVVVLSRRLANDLAAVQSSAAAVARAVPCRNRRRR